MNWLRNYKTTLAGIGAGALNLLASGTSGKEIGLSVALALIGMLAKDGDKSGTVEQPR